MGTDKPKSTIFITGATGLLGSYLLKILLQNGHKVYALSRSKDKQNARNRVIDILNFWDKKVYPKYSRNLKVIEGDMSEEKLGLNQKTEDLLKNDVEEIFHCSAITDFSWPLDKIRSINVDGTRNILNFALNCRNLKKINHISTIYVCGDYRGIFKETNFNMGQNFNTTYEQSKFESEGVVEEYRRKGLWIDVFRPPIIIGESTTGKVLSFDRALYQAVRLWNMEVFDYYPTKDNFKLNIVFVDELCEGILLISRKDFGRNKNYHPFNTQTVTPYYIADLTCKYLGNKLPEFIPYDDYIKRESTPSQLRLLKSNLLFLDRNAILDSSETVGLLAENGLQLACINEKLFQKLLDFAVKKRFLTKAK